MMRSVHQRGRCKSAVSDKSRRCHTRGSESSPRIALTQTSYELAYPPDPFDKPANALLPENHREECTKLFGGAPTFAKLFERVPSFDKFRIERASCFTKLSDGASTFANFIECVTSIDKF